MFIGDEPSILCQKTFPAYFMGLNLHSPERVPIYFKKRTYILCRGTWCVVWNLPTFFGGGGVRNTANSRVVPCCKELGYILVRGSGGV
jgi:hypothetical protein